LGDESTPWRRGALSLCTTPLVEETGAKQTNLSHHMKVLREAGVVETESCGRFVYYRLRPEVLSGLSEQFAALAESARTARENKRHGMNVQVLTDPFGRLLWVSPALPGAVHDVRAVREHGIIDALAQADVTCWADKGHRGAGGTVRTPYWGRWHNLSTGQQAANRSHAKIRALVEQAMAILKSWRLLRKLRCYTTRITSLVQAALTLHLASSER